MAFREILRRSLTNRGLMRDALRRCQTFHTFAPRLERLRPGVIPLRSRKVAKSSEEKQGRHFVDNCRVRVKAGNGGDGSVHLASVFAQEFAGPDGGNGGNGGHVIFRASKTVSSLGHIKHQVQALDGVAGGFSQMDGKNAEDLIVDVPVGTIFRNLEREILAELVQEGAMMIAARGGAGGKGNTSFKTSTRQTPEVAEAGGIGEEFTFDIELRTMAHFGLIGFPNAGKSTLLRAISRARPRVAPYPFTTLKPHIGMVPYDDYVQLAVADIPGIIKDAHKNRGLGISFLRHVERCLCLLYVIDISVPDAFQQFLVLRDELEQYQKGLSDRPHGILANKIDLENSRENLDEFVRQISENFSSQVRVFPISGKMGQNISPLLYFMREMYDSKYKTE